MFRRTLHGWPNCSIANPGSWRRAGSSAACFTRWRQRPSSAIQGCDRPEIELRPRMATVNRRHAEVAFPARTVADAKAFLFHQLGGTAHSCGAVLGADIKSMLARCTAETALKPRGWIWNLACGKVVLCGWGGFTARRSISPRLGPRRSKRGLRAITGREYGRFATF